MKFGHKMDLFFIALKESFISVIPYLILSSFVLLTSQIFILIGIEFICADELSYISTTLNTFLPNILLLSIAFHFSKRVNISGTAGILLSFAIYLTLEALSDLSKGNILAISNDSEFLVLIIPITTIYFLKLFSTNHHKLSQINSQLNTSFKYIIPYIIVFLVSIIFYSAFLLVLQDMASLFVLVTQGINLSNEAALVARSLSIHFFWFLGLHGNNFLELFIGTEHLSQSVFPNLSYKGFYDLFIVYGGAGAGLSLILSIFWCARDSHSKHIAKISLPFAIFNINEILIFGLPIIFNRQLLFPFLLVPLMNMVIALNALHYLDISFSAQNVAWITPIFLNAYLLTDGNLYALVLQLLLLVLGAFIYFPFVKRYSLSQSVSNHHLSLTDNLDVDLEEKEGVLSSKAQFDIIKSNEEVEKIISLISNNNLRLHYQPKVSVGQVECDHFEALLRLEKKDGSIVGPFFLEQLELAGLAPVIDIWVCKEAKEQMKKWSEKGFYPNISINLHPDTLSNYETVQKIRQMLDSYSHKIEFEIVERGLATATDSQKNTFYLREHGFSLSIDDFGTGYSSLDILSTLPVNTLKLDKSLIDILHTPKGYAICKNISVMCTELNFNCVAEGVETEDQFLLVSGLGVKFIQGYYFSKALTPEEVISFVPKFSIATENSK